MGLAALLLLVAAIPPPDLSIVGIVLSGDSSRSRVLLRAEGRTRSVAAGESAFGGQVVSIEPTGVTLAFGDQRIELRLPAQGAGTSVLSLPSPAVPATEPGDRSLSLPRQQLEARLGTEIPRILAETTLVPFYEDGRITGLTLKRMPEGTLLSEAGLQSGDVIREINGTVIDGMATLIGLWTRLQRETSVRAIIEREGRLTTLSLTLE